LRQAIAQLGSLERFGEIIRQACSPSGAIETRKPNIAAKEAGKQPLKLQ